MIFKICFSFQGFMHCMSSSKFLWMIYLKISLTLMCSGCELFLKNFSGKSPAPWPLVKMGSSKASPWELSAFIMSLNPMECKSVVAFVSTQRMLRLEKIQFPKNLKQAGVRHSRVSTYYEKLCSLSFAILYCKNILSYQETVHKLFKMVNYKKATFSAELSWLHCF